MSVFAPRSSLYEPNFSGLFRLIDDFDKYTTETSGTNPSQVLHSRGVSLPHFTPKFDLQETANTYILHGDLPGIEKKDINIDFSDEQTITIHGRVERSHSSESDHGSQQGGKDKSSTGKEVDKAGGDKDKQVSAGSNAPKAKWWISERSVGEFSRSFNFPTRVEVEGVTAKLDNGVLNVVVPKSKKPEGHKISIQ